MKITIHRGANQIGGNCIELRADGCRILLDAGLPLELGDSAPVVPPSLDPKAKLDAVFISHSHPDHYGLLPRLARPEKIFIGAATARILKAASVFVRNTYSCDGVSPMRDRQPIRIGAFTVTPFLVDHSAYDAYALLVEAAGRRLLYSGDIRFHGRKASVMEKLMAVMPANIDALLLEGTTLSREDQRRPMSEDDVAAQMGEIMLSTPGPVWVWTSAQNIDRLVSILKAANQARRNLIIDAYAAAVLAATENMKLPQADWSNIRVYLPRSQRAAIKRDGNFEFINSIKPFRIYHEHLRDIQDRAVFLFRPSMLREFEEAGIAERPTVIYSMWGGYLARDTTRSFLAWLKERKIELHRCHTSGHADAESLQRFARTVNAKMVIPVHTQAAEKYRGLYEGVRIVRDGETFSLSA